MSNPLYDCLFAPLATRQTPLLRLGDGTEIGGAAFLAQVHRSALALRALGVGPGDRVAMQAPKSPEALALYAATVALGAVFLPRYRKFKRPFLAVCRVGGGRASAGLGKDRACASAISASPGRAVWSSVAISH